MLTFDHGSKMYTMPFNMLHTIERYFGYGIKQVIKVNNIWQHFLLVIKTLSLPAMVKVLISNMLITDNQSSFFTSVALKHNKKAKKRQWNVTKLFWSLTRDLEMMNLIYLNVFYIINYFRMEKNLNHHINIVHLEWWMWKQWVECSLAPGEIWSNLVHWNL